MTNEVVEAVSRIFNDNPQITARKDAQQLPINKSWVQKITDKMQKKMYPYKIYCY